eukprot:TRINITY_DN18538_c0_g2_i1.p1 TRINITY_DN18538_c0_g2~~TRINITY_DN18538_c0_g2_i1.p1  ORF type:complete len:695 (-),score=151.46 TRINITY_DN18538_c0_g2_i1:211-2295(-)
MAIAAAPPVLGRTISLQSERSQQQPVLRTRTLSCQMTPTSAQKRYSVPSAHGLENGVSAVLGPSSPGGGTVGQLQSPSLRPLGSPTAARVSMVASPLAAPASVRALSPMSTLSLGPATAAARPAPQRMVILPSNGGVSFVPVASSPQSFGVKRSSAACERSRPPQLNLANSGSASPAPSVRGSDGIAEEEESDEDETPPGVERQKSSWDHYPTTPAFKFTAKALGTAPRFGIDIGGVLTREGDPRYDTKGIWDLGWQAPGAFDAVRRIVNCFGPENVFLVSKVRPGGSMHRKCEQWLHSTCRFCEVTGLPKKNIVFVAKVDGPDGKGPAAAQLGLSHFVDDKIEALQSVFADEAGNSGHIFEKYQGMLFHFPRGGDGDAPPECDMSEVSPIMRRHYRGVKNWAGVLELLRERLPQILKGRAEELTRPLPPLYPDEPPSRAVPQDSSEARASRSPPPWRRPNEASAGRAAVAGNGNGGAVARRAQPERGSVAAAQPAAAAPATTSALQWTSTGRPKLVLKPRDTNLGPTAAFPSTGPSAAVSSAAAPRTGAHFRAASPVSQPAVHAAPGAAMRSEPTASVPCSQAAMQPDPSGGRPRLVLKPRSEAPKPAPAPVTIAPQSPRVTTMVLSPVGANRPSLFSAAPQSPTAARAAPAPVLVAAAPVVTIAPAPARPAMQKDPAGGRPKLVLKPRTVAA